MASELHRPALVTTDDLIPFAQCDFDWNIISANISFETLAGLKKTTAQGKNLRTVFQVENSSSGRASSPFSSSPKIYRRNDGSQICAKFETEKDGSFIRVRVFEFDGLLKRLEDVSNKESTWRNAIEAAGHGVWDYIGSTGSRFYSDQWKIMRGFDPQEEVCGTTKSWEARIHPEDLDRIRENIRQISSGEIDAFSFTYRERRPDGEWIWILSRGRAVKWDANGTPRKLSGTDIDITAIKQAELKRERERDEVHATHLLALEQANKATEAAQEIAQIMSRKDPLTGMPNRRVLYEEINHYIRSDEDSVPGFSVFIIDLDRFKPINDCYGHAVGDIVIRKTATRLQALIGSDCVAARLGGDEFGILMPHAIGPAGVEDAASLATNIIRDVSAAINIGDFDVTVGASVGIAHCPQHGTNSEVLLRHADIAMYEAKNSGRGAYSVFSKDIGKEADSRARLVSDIKQAVLQDQIQPFFQPIMNLETEEVSSFEVLARWNHPEFGPISPERFLPIIERFGLMKRFTNNLLRKACGTVLEWPSNITLTLNISTEQICDTTFPAEILGILVEFGLVPSRLEIEITEQALVKDFEAAKQVIQCLREGGVRVLLDDFGTGYSGLSYLRELQFDCIKIDRSFIASLTKNRESAKIVEAIQILAENLGLETVAEGIEDKETLEAIKSLGTRYGQGFYFAKAISGVETQKFLSRKPISNCA